MDNDNFKKWSDNLSSILPKSAKEAKEDIQKNLTFLIKEAVQKMDLVERSEMNELKKEIESIKTKIKASNKNKAEALLVANNYRRFDYTPYAYRTTNYGRSWNRILGPEDTQSYALCIIEDPKEKNLL